MPRVRPVLVKFQFEVDETVFIIFGPHIRETRVHKRIFTDEGETDLEVEPDKRTPINPLLEREHQIHYILKIDTNQRFNEKLVFKTKQSLINSLIKQ